MTLPSLTEMAQRHPVAILPGDAPSVAAAQKISQAFHESGSENVLIVLLTNDTGMGPPEETVYRTLLDRLHRDTKDVAMLQDFLSTPPLRDVLTSKDGKAWILPVSLVGELGTPASYRAYKNVAGIVQQTVARSPVKVNLTGPASTVADLTDGGARDRVAIELAIAVMLLVILVVIYRNPITMLLPLMTIGASLLTAQAVVAGISKVTGLAVSNQAIVLISAMIAGAGTDYAVFLISRYHDYVRLGSGSPQDSNRAVQRALASTGKVIAASAATVAITFLGMGFAKLGVFSTVGLALAVGIAVAFLAAVTLLPAILVLAGPRGWVAPRRNLTATFWRRSGVRIVRHPAAYLTASLVVLIALAVCASLIHFNYDDRKQLPASDESTVGYAALERHFPVNQTIPEYLLVQSQQDLRGPRALADLEQMAQRISQIPGIAKVRGITRPTGDPLEEAKATYQAGLVGMELGGASNLIDKRTGDLNRLASGTGLMADKLAEVRIQIDQAMVGIRSLVDALSSIQTKFGGSKTLGQMDTAGKLVSSIRALGNTMGINFSTIHDSFSWVGAVVIALNASIVCDMNPTCSAARDQFRKLVTASDDGTLDNIAKLWRQLGSVESSQTVGATASDLKNSLTAVTRSLHSLGLDNPTAANSTMISVQNGANDLAGAGRQIADGVALLVDQTKLMGTGLGRASAFLMEMGKDASQPSMAGFNVPSQVLDTEDFKKLAKIFISPDGHSARYFIQTDRNPFGTVAMDQVNTILDIAQSSQPNTTLSDASISLSGYSATLRDTRDYYNHDIRLIVAVTVIVVLLILMVLLRAIVAPLYLIGSVIISYLSAIGIGVVMFQMILRQELHWSVPGLAFVVLVAVGADYNMLLASRLREEAGLGKRASVIRTVGATGGVITAAGLIFAASMFGLLFASIGAVVQAGFVIGAGLLIDTFVVRTITVPAIVALVPGGVGGPARPWRQRSHGKAANNKTGIDAVTEAAPEGSTTGS